MPVDENETSFTYVVTYAPPECEQVHVGQRIRLFVADPPPATMTLNYGGVCDGVVATLAS